MGKAIDRLKYIHDHAIYLSQEDTEALEEAIDAMNKLEKIELIVTNDYHVITNECIDIAIATMRKYQQIRQIAFPLQFCTTDKLNHEAIMKICEVIEDGNDD